MSLHFGGVAIVGASAAADRAPTALRVHEMDSSKGTKRKIAPFYSSSPSSPSTGVIVPKRPSFSLLIPAEKNRVLAGPAPISLPNVSDHSPSMVSRELSGFIRNPSNLYVKPLNAAIQPLPKLPTRIALLNSPKSRVVHTNPQGALNQSPFSRWPMCLPLGA